MKERPVDRPPLFRAHAFSPLEIVAAEGSWLVTATGSRLLDLEAGVWCVGLGHRHPAVDAAARAQLDRVTHLPARLTNRVAQDAAQALISTLPADDWRVLFLSSGSEAVELAIRIAQLFTRRVRVLGLRRGYVGAFGLAGAASGKRPDEAVELLDTHLAGTCTPDASDCAGEEPGGPAWDDVAALVFEPWQISGGVYQPCPRQLAKRARAVRAHGGLVVADEVTTGLGRLGLWYGFTDLGLVPDIVCLGKGLGNGFPVSAVAVRGTIEAALVALRFQYVQSHQNDPLGCAVAKAVLETLQQEELVPRAADTGRRLGDLFERFAATHAKRFGVRGTGMAWGLAFEDDAKRPTLPIRAVHQALLARGLVTGIREDLNLVRMLPPLNLAPPEVDFLAERLEDAVAAVADQES